MSGGNMVGLTLKGIGVFKMRIRRLFSSPVFADEEQTRRAWVLHFTLWSILLVFDSQFYVVFFILPQHWARWLMSLLVINFTLPPLVLMNRHGRTRLAGILLVVTLWLLVTGMALTAGGIHAPVVLAYVVDVLIAGLLFGEIGGVIAGIIACLTGLGFVLLETTGHLPANRVTPTAMSLWVNLTLFLEFIVIFQFLANHSIKAGLKQAMQELHRRRQTEIALSESEQRYREVFETTSDVIVVTDVTVEGKFLLNRCNPACEKVLGVTPGGIAGKPYDEFFTPEQVQRITANLQRCVDQKSPISYERSFYFRGQGLFHFYTTLIPVKDAAGRICRIVRVSHNITERKEAEIALCQSRDELEARVQERTAELQRVNKELDAFSFSVSHDLRRPLRTMTGFADLLTSVHAGDLPGEAQELLAGIKESALRMNQLIDDLLNLSRIDRQPLVPRTVNLAALARKTIDELRAEQPIREMDIRVAELPDCRGDPALLRQVFVNLLSNAMKFTGNRPVALIEVEFKTEGKQTIYFVRDNGAGFDMQYAGKLFGVFQRMHSSEKFAGTGVGLSIVQRIIHRHGGKIWAESAVDQGATFYFTLPGPDQKPQQVC
jgi:PAS domain S-box-containing protein